MTTPLQKFSAKLRETLAPRERWSPSQWAERAPRIIPDNGVNPEPGPMRFSRTPYLREIADTICEAGTEIVVFVKPTQVGYTTLLEMMPGYWADLDPGACMIVEPDEVSAKGMLASRVLPTLRDTPCLARHMSERSWDTKKDVIKLDTMPIFAAWAGSPMRVAMWAIRYMLFDEVDKYPKFAGDEGDPIMLGIKRVSNWLHRSRVVIGSTPTVRDGNVWKWYEACGDKRRFWVPCPHCGEYQVLIWAQVKWPEVGKGEERSHAADKINAGKLAWYECEHCKARIDDRHKPDMLVKGVWASEDQVVARDGATRGPRHRSGRIGFHLNSIYSPWLTFSALASEFLLAIGDPARMMDFRNSRLAEPFEEQATKIAPEVYTAKIERAEANGIKPGIVPMWAGVVTMTVDTQKDHFWACIRAWGNKFRSRLIYFDRLESFEEVEGLFRTPLRMENGAYVQPRICLIDSGGTADPETGVSRTSQVYQFSLRNPSLFIPTKGASQAQINPIRHTQVTPKLPDGMGRMPTISMVIVETNWFKDLLSARINDKEVEWELTSDALKLDYCRQMASEHKIFDRKAGKYRWVPISMGSPNHAWDCEVLQNVAADLSNVSLIPENYIHGANDNSIGDERQQSRERERGGSWASQYRGKY